MKNIKIIISVVIVLMLIVLGVFLYNKVILDYVEDASIELIGEEIVNISLNDEYQEMGAKAYLRGKDISDLVKLSNNIDNTKVGKYIVEYTAVNKSGKEVKKQRIINVIDSVAPSITLKGKTEVSIYVGDKYNEEGYEAKDNYDGDITTLVEIEGSVDSSKEGEYTLKYKVKDTSNNIDEVTRKVKVIKNPVIKVSSNSSSKVQTTSKGLPVLMYHFFYNKAKGETGKDNNFMEISDFEAQMKYLSENNYYFPTWKEVEQYVGGSIKLPGKSVVITVDDGDESFFRLAVPIIKKYNVRATSFVVTTWTGKSTISSYKSQNIIFQSHSNDMHRAGSNGKGRIMTMTQSEIVKDLKKSQEVIGGSNVFCYPFGHYNDTAKKALKEAGFTLAFTTKGGRIYPGMDKLQLPRVRMSKGDSLTSFAAKVK